MRPVIVLHQQTMFVAAADLPAPDGRHSAPATLVADIQACEPQMDKLIRAGIDRVLAARATKKQAEADTPSQLELQPR